MKITKGLDLPVSGVPEQEVSAHPRPSRVAVLGRDFHDLRPAMQVQEGDHVKIGQVLFSDRKNTGINFTAPGAGTVIAINRGARRVLNSVVIRLDGQEESLDFGAHAAADLAALDADTVRTKLLESGQWIAFRNRPYGKPPAADAVPSSIFVGAMDTRPLAADPAAVLQQEPGMRERFLHGLTILSRLAPAVHVCYRSGADIPRSEAPGVSYHDFDGPHPAGLPGTHIHFIDPVSEARSVWYLNYQDVAAIGSLFTTGKLQLERVIALAGPSVKHPRLIRTRLGASTDEMVEGELDGGAVRVISGSILAGHRSAGWSAYLGRYNLQVSVLSEEEPRIFLHWLNPFLKEFSLLRVFFNRDVADKSTRFAFTTTQNGSPRAMVPLGNFERIMPLDILPTQLLRALLTRDTTLAQELGALELDEEDLSLCTFVCHGKYEYGSALRDCLRMIEKGE
ncbi:MAG TPA: Na(+)-translocating NADH-quinone reductase subunit A [Thiolinea sp.]|nr:Na(+)-translocating NADH-quinone reductase subunit A [Thiolinea sp.]